MTYYSIPKILEIMKDYHKYISAIEDYKKEYASVGVGQYGIEASLPKGNNISNPVEQEALKQMDDIKYYADIRTNMKYLEDRLDRVQGDLCKEILGLRLEGLTIREIAEVTGYAKSYVHRLTIKIAEYIRGDRLCS